MPETRLPARRTEPRIRAYALGAHACDERIIRSIAINIKAPIARLALCRHDTLIREAARGALVRCQDGLLWITQDGDLADHIVGPGDSFRVEREGSVLVQATQPARVAIESPREEVSGYRWRSLARAHA